MLSSEIKIPDLLLQILIFNILMIFTVTVKLFIETSAIW